MGDAGADWFCLYTGVGDEFRARAGLEAQQLQCYLPVMVVARRVRGRVVEKRLPLLSRYLFVCMDGRELSQARSVIGVEGILPREHEPLPIPAYEIERLQEREAAGEFVFKLLTYTDRRRQRRVLRSLAELAVVRDLCLAA